MRNKGVISAAAFIVCLAGALTCGLTASHEPEFQGIRLGAWLANAGHLRLNPGDLASDRAVQGQIEYAVRQIGTNALPHLLTMISAKDGPIKKTLCSWLEASNIIPIRPQSDQDSHLLALLGFTILGPMAKPAVPALINLLKEKDSDVAFLAASALGRIGPAASNAVPALIMNLDSQDFAVRYMATNSLRRISPSAVLNPPVAASSA